MYTGRTLIKGVLDGAAAHCVPPREQVAWACFMLGERVDSGKHLPVHAGNTGAVA